MIRVLFFAQLREQLQCAHLDLVAGPETVDALRAHLIEQRPQWREFLVRRTLLIAVNKTCVKAGHPIRDGDEVAFFPPVTGG